VTAPQPPGGPQQPSDPGICRCCGKQVALFSFMTCREFDAMVRDWFSTGLARSPWHYIRPASPLEHYKQHGIEMGIQEETLTRLAAQNARRFTVAELADELFEVMEASPQDSGDPWRRWHAVSIAARARRFTDRSDAAQEKQDAEFMRFLHTSGFLRWAEAALARAPRPARQVRVPGARRQRKPGRAT
jgi:hypothetical protein